MDASQVGNQDFGGPFAAARVAVVIGPGAMTPESEMATAVTRKPNKVLSPRRRWHQSLGLPRLRRGSKCVPSSDARHSTALGPGPVELLRRITCLLLTGLMWLVRHFQVTVLHILPTGEVKPHKLTAGAKVVDRTVTYPGQPTLFNIDTP